MLKSLGQIAIFIICAQTLLYLRAKESYEKYMKLIVSMMLLLLLIQSLHGSLYRNGLSDIVQIVADYEKRMQDIVVQIQPAEQDMKRVSEYYVDEAKEQTVQNQETVGTVEAPPQGTGGTSGVMNDIVVEPIKIGGEDGRTESVVEEVPVE